MAKRPPSIAGISDEDPDDGPGTAPAVSGPNAGVEPGLSIERHEVANSSHLQSVGYDNRSGILTVEFKDGEIYQYENVPEGVMLDFITAKSQGRFFQQSIANQFEYRRIK